MHSTRITLRVNAFTCAVFGIIFAIYPSEVSKNLGTIPSHIIAMLGFLLTGHAVHLLFTSLKKTVSKLEIYYFSAGDQAWFLASLALLIMTDWISTPIGYWMTIAVATMVSTIGLMQLWAYAEATNSGVPNRQESKAVTDQFLMPSTLSRLKSIGVSWLGIKTWVKVWLFVLNGVFLIAFLFLPSQLSQVTLTAYAASLPLMLSIMIVQRGLTRLLGLGHLVVWGPLLAYIFLRLFSNSAGSQISYQTNPELFSYSVTLFISLCICLALDTYDLLRWLLGNQARLGASNERHEHNTAG